MRYLPHNKQISAPSQTVADERISPKICQGQPPTYGSSCSKFHPNWFTVGGVIAERVKAILLTHKVFPWFALNTFEANKHTSTWLDTMWTVSDNTAICFCPYHNRTFTYEHNIFKAQNGLKFYPVFYAKVCTDDYIRILYKILCRSDTGFSICLCALRTSHCFWLFLGKETIWRQDVWADFVTKVCQKTRSSAKM